MMNDCWLWPGYVSPTGYARSKANGDRQTVLVHRAAYEALVGPIPAGLELDHLCKTRNCYNPRHLEPVTHAENMQRADMSRNGQHNAAKTHCPQGHLYDEDNTLMSGGRRRCRECGRERNRINA